MILKDYVSLGVLEGWGRVLLARKFYSFGQRIGRKGHNCLGRDCWNFCFGRPDGAHIRKSLEYHSCRRLQQTVLSTTTFAVGNTFDIIS